LLFPAFFQISVLISVSNSNLQNEESINNGLVLDNDVDVPNVDAASKKTKGGTHLEVGENWKKQKTDTRQEEAQEVLVGKKDSRDLETETIRTMARTTRRKIQNPKTKRWTLSYFMQTIGGLTQSVLSTQLSTLHPWTSSPRKEWYSHRMRSRQAFAGSAELAWQPGSTILQCQFISIGMRLCSESWGIMGILLVQ
jgi:hypothetical protein